MKQNEEIMDRADRIKSCGVEINEIFFCKTEEEQIKCIRNHPYSIQFIKNPSEALCLEAVKQFGSPIQYIKHPSEAVCLEAIKENVESINYLINKVSDELFEKLIGILEVKDILE